MTLAPLKTLVLGKRRRSSMVRLQVFNLENYLSSEIYFTFGNPIAPKILIWRNAKISCNSLLAGGLRLRYFAVDPHHAGACWTAARRLIAFPLPNAYRCHSVDPRGPVCRNSIACHPRPLAAKLPLGTFYLSAFRKQVVKITINSFCENISVRAIIGQRCARRHLCLRQRLRRPSIVKAAVGLSWC